MHQVTNLRVAELNKLVTCTLCGGYLIDATTVVECLHSFCRSCLVLYLNGRNTCPDCGVLLHKTRPHLAIRSDRALQAIVYKLVPGLFDREMERRRCFYSANLVEDKCLSPEKRGDLSFKSFVFHEEDRVSLELEYYAATVPPATTAALTPHTPGGGGTNIVTYLLCPAGLTVASLAKLLRSKLDLSPHRHQVVLFFGADFLAPEYSLIDLAYIYSWRRQRPLKLYFTVLDTAGSRHHQSHLPSSSSTGLNTGLLGAAAQHSGEDSPVRTESTAATDDSPPATITTGGGGGLFVNTTDLKLRSYPQQSLPSGGHS